MKRKNVEDTNDESVLLFETRGWPKRMVCIFIFFGLLVGTSMLSQIWEICHAPRGIYWEDDTYPYDVPISPERKALRESQRNAPRWQFRDVMGIVFMLVIEITNIIFGLDGRKIYFRIYDDHIEGCAGMSFMSNEVEMPIEEIGLLGSNKMEMLPYLIIYSNYGHRFEFIMGGRKLKKAERLLRRMVTQVREQAD